MNIDYEILQVSRNLIEVSLFGEKIHIDKDNLYKALGEVIHWQKRASNFTAQLMGLIAKADFFNRVKLAKGFPEEVFAYLLWYWEDGLVECEEEEEYIEKLRKWLKDSSRRGLKCV